MYPVYLGFLSKAATLASVHPAVSPGGGYAAGSPLRRQVMVGTDSLSSARQEKIWVTTGPRAGSVIRRLLVRPWAALTGTGCGIRSARYP
jgi:hypothetical protein